jgi:hypothetical protein
MQGVITSMQDLRQHAWIQSLAWQPDPVSLLTGASAAASVSAAGRDEVSDLQQASGPCIASLSASAVMAAMRQGGIRATGWKPMGSRLDRTCRAGAEGAAEDGDDNDSTQPVKGDEGMLLQDGNAQQLSRPESMGNGSSFPPRQQTGSSGLVTPRMEGQVRQWAEQPDKHLPATMFEKGTAASGQGAGSMRPFRVTPHVKGPPGAGVVEAGRGRALPLLTVKQKWGSATSQVTTSTSVVVAMQSHSGGNVIRSNKGSR